MSICTSPYRSSIVEGPSSLYLSPSSHILHSAAEGPRSLRFLFVYYSGIKEPTVQLCFAFLQSYSSISSPPHHRDGQAEEKTYIYIREDFWGGIKEDKFSSWRVETEQKQKGWRGKALKNQVRSKVISRIRWTQQTSEGERLISSPWRWYQPVLRKKTELISGHLLLIHSCSAAGGDSRCLSGILLSVQLEKYEQNANSLKLTEHGNYGRNANDV